MAATVKGLNKYFWIFLVAGLSTQIATFCLTDTGWLSFVSGIFGICAVVLCSQGNIWFYLFGFFQTITAGIICYQNHLYGGIGINIFYLVTEVYGLYLWHKRLEEGTAAIKPRKMAWQWEVGLGTLTIALSYLLALYFRQTNDPQPFLDAFTTLPAITGQMLMIFAFSEHWYIWLMIDIAQVALWIGQSDWCMTAQYAFWCINATYGILNWQRKIRSSV